MQLLDRRQHIESVRAHNPIEQVLARYIELRPSGRRFVGHCPFHADRTPSLVVYPHNQSWYCFGCDVGGDVFRFVERIEHLSFAEVLQRLGVRGGDTESGRAGEGVRGRDGEGERGSAGESGGAGAGEHGRKNARMGFSLAPSHPVSLSPTLGDEHFTLLTAATEVYHAAIFTQPRVLEYLAKRRIDLDVIRRHHIGYVTGNDLAKYFRFRGWNPEIGNDLGLIGPRGEYFRQRIVIPELRGGRAIYLVGRATQKYQRAKYLGLPGAPKPLYGLEMIQQAKEVFVCEGPMDWLTLVQWGYPAIALLGSHLKQEQINELADAERVFIVTDSDAPGRESARRLAAMLGERARIVPPLPNAKDVNELAMRPRAREMFAALVQKE